MEGKPEGVMLWLSVEIENGDGDPIDIGRETGSTYPVGGCIDYDVAIRLLSVLEGVANIVCGGDMFSAEGIKNDISTVMSEWEEEE